MVGLVTPLMWMDVKRKLRHGFDSRTGYMTDEELFVFVMIVVAIWIVALISVIYDGKDDDKE